jgi:hypothetical protein
MGDRYIARAISAGGYQYKGCTIANGIITQQTWWYYSLSVLINHNQDYMRAEVKPMDEVQKLLKGAKT